MLKMQLKLSSVASVGPQMSALKAIGFTEAASIVFRCIFAVFHQAAAGDRLITSIVIVG